MCSRISAERLRRLALPETCAIVLLTGYLLLVKGMSNARSTKDVQPEKKCKVMRSQTELFPCLRAHKRLREQVTAIIKQKASK